MLLLCSGCCIVERPPNPDASGEGAVFERRSRTEMDRNGPKKEDIRIKNLCIYERHPDKRRIGLKKAYYADPVFNLLHWYAGMGGGMGWRRNSL